MPDLPVQWRCLGKPPQQPPCGATITSDRQAEQHVKATQRAVVSGLVGPVLDRAVARFRADMEAVVGRG